MSVQIDGVFVGSDGKYCIAVRDTAEGLVCAWTKLPVKGGGRFYRLEGRDLSKVLNASPSMRAEMLAGQASDQVGGATKPIEYLPNDPNRPSARNARRQAVPVLTGPEIGPPRREPVAGDRIVFEGMYTWEVGESIGRFTAAVNQTATIIRIDDEYIHLRMDDPGFFLKDYSGGCVSLPVDQAHLFRIWGE